MSFPFFKKVVSSLITIALLIPYSLPTVQAKGVDPEEKVYFYLQDHLGGVDVVVDEDGKVVERQDYLPYGKERLTVPGDSTHQEDYGFTSKELDEETDLMYYEARYYDPVVGRFTSQDAWEGDLENPQTLNKYTYGLNNPINNIDPSGNIVESAWDLANTLFDFGAIVKNDIEVVRDIAQYTYGDITKNNELKEEAYSNLKQNTAELKTSLVDLTADTAATAIPFVPAGTTKGRRIVQNSDKLSDAVSGISQKALDRVKNRLKGLTDRKHKIGDIKAFGSRTKGTYKPNSDVDIFVEIGSDNTKHNSRIRNIFESIKQDFNKSTGKKLDLQPFKSSDVGPVTKFNKKDLVDF